MIRLKVEKINPNAILPKQATKGSAGFDLFSTVNVELYQNQTIVIDTGLKFEIPDGHLMYISSKSGLSRKNNIFVLNSPALIDSDYRGEVSIILSRLPIKQYGVINMENMPYNIKKGDKIAQFVVLPYPQVILEEGVVNVDTERGEGGFGSTGL